MSPFINSFIIVSMYRGLKSAQQQIPLKNYVCAPWQNLWSIDQAALGVTDAKS